MAIGSLLGLVHRRKHGFARYAGFLGGRRGMFGGGGLLGLILGALSVRKYLRGRRMAHAG